MACDILFQYPEQPSGIRETMEIEKNRKIMTIEEVSAFLRIPASTIYELAKKGKIRGVKFGKHWRFLEEDILGFFKIVAVGGHS